MFDLLHQGSASSSSSSSSATASFSSSTSLPLNGAKIDGELARPPTRTSAASSLSKAKRRPWSAGANGQSPAKSFDSSRNSEPQHITSHNARPYQPTMLSSESGMPDDQPRSTFTNRLRSESHSSTYSPLLALTSTPTSSSSPTVAVSYTHIASPSRVKARITGRGGAGMSTFVSPDLNGQTATASSPSNASPAHGQGLPAVVSPVTTSPLGTPFAHGLGPSVLRSSSTHSETRRHPHLEPSSAQRVPSSDSGITNFDASSSPAHSPGWAEVAPPSVDGLQSQPLPVRLGLVPPFAPEDLEQVWQACTAHPFHGKPSDTGARYTDGYYLYIPPPKAIRPGLAPMQHQGKSSKSASGIVSSQDGVTSAATVEKEKPRTTLHKMGSFHSHTRGGATCVSSRLKNSAIEARPSLPTTAPWDLKDYFIHRQYRTSVGAKRISRRHAFSPTRVPYIWSHSQEAKESELTLHNATYDILSQRHSLIPFEEPKPARILDIGTGTGAWCIDAARDWRDSEFVGLDVVPCQTPLESLKDPDLQKRISWVVSNFLEELPFPSKSFDFVHVRYVGSSSIQEDQWDDFVTEAARILKPDGYLEILENNLTFVGNVTNIAVSRMRRLAAGQAFGSAVIVPASEQVPQPPREFGALEDATERLVARRFINSKVLSVIPTALIVANLSDVQIGNPRRMPLLADPSDGVLLVETDPSKLDWSKQYTVRSQVGRGLTNSGFAPKNLSALTQLVTTYRAEKVFAMRDLLWQEVEEEKNTLLTQSTGPMGQGRGQGGATDNRNASWAHPWKDRGAFDQDIDALRARLWARADTGSLLRDSLGWRDGELESVEERKAAARKEKMTRGSNTLAASPSCDFRSADRGSGSEAAGNQQPSARHPSHDEGADRTPSSSGISVAMGLPTSASQSPQQGNRSGSGDGSSYHPGPANTIRRSSLAFAMSPAYSPRASASTSRPSSSGSVGPSNETRSQHFPFTDGGVCTGSSSNEGQQGPNPHSPRSDIVQQGPDLLTPGRPHGDNASVSRGNDMRYDDGNTNVVQGSGDSGSLGGGARLSTTGSTDLFPGSKQGNVESAPAFSALVATPPYIGVLGFFESTGFTARGKAAESAVVDGGDSVGFFSSPRTARSLSPSAAKHADGGGGGPFLARGPSSVSMAGRTPSQRASRLQPQSHRPPTTTGVTADENVKSSQSLGPVSYVSSPELDAASTDTTPTPALTPKAGSPSRIWTWSPNIE